MSQATQELPSWLSYSLTTISDANGTPLTTSTSIIYLPLTYYGPSIPLDSDWTYGGLTSPAPTSSSVSASQTSISASQTSSATSSSSQSSVSTSQTSATSSFPTATPSTSSSSSATPSPSSSSTSNSSSLDKGALIGVIVGSILGLLVLFIFCLLFFLIWSSRRKRRRGPEWAMVSPIEDDYYIVPPGGQSPGEGSPRHSGDEAAPFLNRDGQMRQSGAAAPVSVAGPATAVNDGSVSSSNKSSSAASGYGTLLDRPSLGVRIPPEQRRGNILTPEQLRHLDEESVLPPNTDLSPAMQPPRLVASTTSIDHPAAVAVPSLLPSFSSRDSFAPSIQPWELAEPGARLTNKPSQASITPSMQAEQNNEPTLHTARRVRMDSSVVSPPQSLMDSPTEGSSNRRSSWKAMGLGGLAGLTRLSWFKNNDSPSSSKRNSRASGGQRDNDIESGRALLAEHSASGSRLAPRRGLDPTGERPISTFSTKSTGAASGPSIYYDAASSIPTTPLPTLPPRALASDPDPEFGGWPATHIEEPSDTATSTTHHADHAVDVLDMPAPRGLSPYASSNSLRDSSTISSAGKKNFPYPPGLPTPTVWNDTAGTTPSVGSFAANSSVGAGNRQSSGITIDVLEEAPPVAGQSWRSIAGTDSGNKRTTFGLPNYMQTPDYASEQASLHSMRSHLSPSSSRSAGSAPATRRDASSSQSSRRTGSSGSGPSLVHSNSISSDGRKHGRGLGPRSPTLSVFGEGVNTSPRLLPMMERLASEDSEGPHSRSTSNSHSHSHSSHSHGRLEPLPEGVAIDGPSHSQGRADSEQPLSRPTSPLQTIPWAGGLDTNWTAT